METARRRHRAAAVAAAFVFAGFALGEWFAGWYLSNEQGFEGSHDGTRQLMLAAGFGAAALWSLARGVWDPAPLRGGVDLVLGLAAQVGLCALAVYLVDQSQKGGGSASLVVGGVVAVAGALLVPVALARRA